MVRQKGLLGALECVRTFFHSIDQTGILRPKGRLDNNVADSRIYSSNRNFTLHKSSLMKAFDSGFHC
jgi:hypothetical protein